MSIAAGGRGLEQAWGHRVAVVQMEHAEVAATSAGAQHQVYRRLFSDAVVDQITVVLEWSGAVEQALLVGRDILLRVDLGFDACNDVAGLDLEDDSPAREGNDEDLHEEKWVKMGSVDETQTHGSGINRNGRPEFKGW